MKRGQIVALVLLVLLAAAVWALFRAQGAYTIAPESAQNEVRTLLTDAAVLKGKGVAAPPVGQRASVEFRENSAAGLVLVYTGTVRSGNRSYPFAAALVKTPFAPQYRLDVQNTAVASPENPPFSLSLTAGWGTVKYDVAAEPDTGKIRINERPDPGFFSVLCGVLILAAVLIFNRQRKKRKG